jgi:hypothetical protein
MGLGLKAAVIVSPIPVRVNVKESSFDPVAAIRMWQVAVARRKRANQTDYGRNGGYRTELVQLRREPQPIGRSISGEDAMPLPDSPSFKDKLVGKHVIVKVSLFSRAFPGTVAATDETGFCFVSDEMVTALREITGKAMANVDAPNIYLPFSGLEWLVFSEPKAAAASA